MPCELDMLAPGSQWASECFSEDGSLNLALLMPFLEHFLISAATGSGPGLFTALTLKITFPDSLRSLEAYDVPELKLDVLPPHLTKLHAPASSYFDHDFILSLPQTITSLELRIVEFDESWRFYQSETIFRNCIEHEVSDWLSRRQIRDILASNDPDWSSILPPDVNESISTRLKELHARRFDGIGLAHRLPNLTHLGLYHRNWAGECSLDPLRLPDTIKSLRFEGSFGYPPEPIGRDSWPSSLTTLFFSAAQHLIPSDLPPHVTCIGNATECVSSPPYDPNGYQSYERSPNDGNITDAIRCWGNTVSRRSFDFSYTDGLHTILIMSGPFRRALTLEQISTLPRTLTRLEYPFIQDEFSQISKLGERFPSLPLRIRGTPSSLASIKPKEGEESFWPPNLTSLKAQILSDFFLSLLPSSLTEYHFGEIVFDSELAYSIAQEMSDHLKVVSNDTLLASSRALWQVSTRRFFKPQLLYNGDCLPHLYPFTQSIDLSFMSSVSAAQFHGFKVLHTITCELEHCDISNARFLWQYLPPTLTHLHLNSKKLDFTEEFLLEMPSNIKKLKLPQLPRTLMSAAIMFPTGKYGTELNESTLEEAYNGFIASFDGRVEIGDVVTDILLTPTDTLEGLPSNILSINLPSDTGNIHFYHILPPSLTKLQLNRAILGDDQVQLLPASLVYLQIDEGLSISTEGMKHIPQLTTLKLRSNSRLTSGSIPFLPSTLTCLDLHSVPFTDTFIDRLPTGITDLDISWSSISQDALKLLPRGLTSLDIEYGERLETADPSGLPPSLTSLRAPVGLAERITSELLPNLVKVEAPSEVLTDLFDF